MIRREPGMFQGELGMLQGTGGYSGVTGDALRRPGDPPRAPGPGWAAEPGALGARVPVPRGRDCSPGESGGDGIPSCVYRRLRLGSR